MGTAITAGDFAGRFAVLVVPLKDCAVSKCARVSRDREHGFHCIVSNVFQRDREQRFQAIVSTFGQVQDVSADNSSGLRDASFNQ